MASSSPPAAPRWRWPRTTLVVTAAAVLATVIIVSRRTLVESLRNLGQLDWAWFVLAIAAEAISLAAFGLSRRRLLRAEGHQAGLGSVMAITYASNALSMSVPFAGTQLAALFSYRQFRRRGLLLAYGAGATAGSTGVTPGGFALVEIALTAALVAAGMHAPGALTAVLAYRLVNFWLILLGGGIAVMVLSRAAHRVRGYPQPRRDVREPVSNAPLPGRRP